MIYKTTGGYRKTIIKDSTQSYSYLINRFKRYPHLILTCDNNGLTQGSCKCDKNGKVIFDDP
jgi:hypothetical protein